MSLQHTHVPGPPSAQSRTALLTQRETARLLRLSERTLERLRLTGGGPLFVKCGRREKVAKMNEPGTLWFSACSGSCHEALQQYLSDDEAGR